MDQAKAGAAALEAGNYDEAIQLYTKALAQNPSAAPYYIARSTAHQRTAPPNLDAALKDAELAVALAVKRAKRELIVDAQFRRAVTLFALGRYADAQFVLGVVKRMNKEHKTLPVWEMKMNQKLADLSEDDEKKHVTVVEVPDVEAPTAAPTSGQQSNGSTQAASAAVQSTPAEKIRHDWYQSNESVSISILAKGVPADKASVDIEERSLSVSFPTTSGTVYSLDLDPLFAPVDVEKSSFRITPSKIEIILVKVSSGQKWSSLEATSSDIISPSVATSAASSTIPASSSASAPTYPTSSRSGPKNWDKLVNDMTKKKTEKKDGDDDVDYDDLEDEGGDPANAFFQKLYKNADPDTRRAMMKSYQESNGTALSTNWAEVSKAKVETSPPDGMEAKPW